MFSELGNYLDNDFLNSHRNINIYTPERDYVAEIFSCYSISINVEETNLKGLDFNEKIDYYKEKSNFKTDITENIDRIIKLSTCSYINANTHPTNQRYYIIAKLNDVKWKNKEGKLLKQVTNRIQKLEQQKARYELEQEVGSQKNIMLVSALVMFGLILWLGLAMGL